MPAPDARQGGNGLEWARVSALLDALLDLPESERPAYLDEQCGDDGAFRQEVTRKLSACEKAEKENALAPGSLGFASALSSLATRIAEMREGQLSSLRSALVDRYHVDREIGHGGMATIYLATDRRLDRQVAVKVLDPAVAALLGSRRFLEEIRVTATMQHPLILPLFDSGESEGMLWYVMPYISGASLREALDQTAPLPVRDALCIARDVASALSHAHSHGVVHRDVAPGNILLGQGYAILGDFGIARALHRLPSETLTASGLALGTMAYMSPEQRAGSRDVDGRSDVFALGCVLHEMISGKLPAPDVNGIQTVIADIPGDIEPLIRKMLTPQPGKRPDASTVLSQIDALLHA